MLALPRISTFQSAVRKFIQGTGGTIPAQPKVPDLRARTLCARLLLEETLETIEALGLQVQIPSSTYPVTPVKMGQVQFQQSTSKISQSALVSIVDGLADVIYVAHYCLAKHGVADEAILEEVAENNALKLQNGTQDPKTGKLIKPVGHPKPRFLEILKEQGYQPAKESPKP